MHDSDVIICMNMEGFSAKTTVSEINRQITDATKNIRRLNWLAQQVKKNKRRRRLGAAHPGPGPIR